MGCPRPNTVRSDPYDIGQLAEPLRSRFWTAVLMAPAHGLVLVSGFRDPGRQWDIRHDRVPHGQECNPAARAHPATAVPYASDHQKRTAADAGGRALQWLIDHREALGVALTVSSENWHFSADRRDVRTGRVHNRPTVPIIPFGVIPPGYTPTPGRGGTGNAKPANPNPPARPAEDDSMSAQDVEALKRYIDDKFATTEQMPFAVESPNGQTWICRPDATRFAVATHDQFQVYVFMRQCQPPGPRGIPKVDEEFLSGWRLAPQPR